LRPPTIEGALVGKHQQPGLEAPLLNVELMDRAEHVQEDLLYGIFRFGIVPKNASSDPEQNRAVSFEEDCERIWVSALQLICQFFI